MRVRVNCPTCAAETTFIHRLGDGARYWRPVCPNGHAFNLQYDAVYAAECTPLPACCGHLPTDSFAKKLYAAYNRGGDLATAGLNARGEPYPTWEELPPNVRAKWEALAAIVA